MMTHTSIAIIGAGATGLYLADQFMCQDLALHIDIYDSQPAPVGVASYAKPQRANHKTKTTTYLIGNVRVGHDLPLEELEQHYDAVIDTRRLHEPTQLALNVLVTKTLLDINSPHRSFPTLRITFAHTLLGRGIPATIWDNPLDLPTGRSLAEWEEAITIAHGAPICF